MNIAAYRHYLRELVSAKSAVRADDLTSDLLTIRDENPAGSRWMRSPRSCSRCPSQATRQPPP